MVADQPLDPVGEGGVVAGEPIGAVGGEYQGHLVLAELDGRMVVCGLGGVGHSVANRIADRKPSWTKVSAMTSPVRCQPGNSGRARVAAALSRLPLLRSSLSLP
jgi:hypothetical protein